MNRLRFFIVMTAMVLVSAATVAETPKPGPEHQKLGVFVGSWRLEGRMEASPFSPAGPMKGTMKCAWFPGEFWVVCDSVDKGPGGGFKSHAMYGYNKERARYEGFGLDSAGFGGPFTGKLEGDVWSWEGQDSVNQKVFWNRTVLKVMSPKELTWKSEISEDGKTWKLMSEGKVLKR